MGFRINTRPFVLTTLTNHNPVYFIESFANRIIFFCSLEPSFCQLTYHYHNDRHFWPRSLLVNWSDDQRTSKTQNSETHACATYKKKSTDDLALFMSGDRRMELKGTM